MLRLAPIAMSIFLLTSCVSPPKAGKSYTGAVAFSLTKADQTVKTLRIDTDKIAVLAVRTEFSAGLDSVHSDLTTAKTKLSVATKRIDQDAGLIAARDKTIRALRIYQIIVWTVALGGAAVILLPLALKLIKFIP